MPKSEEKQKSVYFEGTGRRKTAVARVRLVPGGKTFIVNGKPVEAYFQDMGNQKMCREIFESLSLDSPFEISVKTAGGGITAQAEAIRHGIARALLLWNPELKSLLKKFDYLKRDSRMRERKKFGLVRARRARQWRKR